MKEHKISLVTAILMTVNIMVGSGILIGPGDMARVAGNAGFLSWLIVATLFMPIVLSTVQMSRMNPGSGGFFRYAKAGLNTTAGYWSGMLYIGGYTFAVAVEILALRQLLYESLGLNWTWFTGTPLLFNGVVVALLVGLNLLGLKFYSRIVNSLTIWKIVPIVTLIALLPFILNPSFVITAAEVSKLPQALPMAIFGFFGFEYACSISHHIEDSERNAPRAILLGFLMTALLYTLFTFAALHLMGPVELSQQGASLFADFIALPVPYLKALLQLLIPVAAGLTLFAAAIGLLNANAVMLHSMAEHNLFYFSEYLKPLSSRHRPYVTVLIISGLAFCIASMLPSISIVGNLCNTGVLMSFILPFVSLIILQRQHRRHRHVLLASIALVMVLGLSLYSITKLGATMGERFLYFLPFAAFLAVAAFMYKGETFGKTV